MYVPEEESISHLLLLLLRGHQRHQCRQTNTLLKSAVAETVFLLPSDAHRRLYNRH